MRLFGKMRPAEPLEVTCNCTLDELQDRSHWRLRPKIDSIAIKIDSIGALALASANLEPLSAIMQQNFQTCTVLRTIETDHDAASSKSRGHWIGAPVGPSRPQNPRVFDPAREAGRENQLRVQLPGDDGYTPHLRWLTAWYLEWQNFRHRRAGPALAHSESKTSLIIYAHFRETQEISIYPKLC